VLSERQVIDRKSAAPIHKDNSQVLKTAIFRKTGTFGTLEFGIKTKKDGIIDVFKMAKGWSAIPQESVLSMAKHLRGHKIKLAKHRCNLEVRCNFFTERFINRWNSLDQIH